jgi:hypothetical protein
MSRKPSAASVTRVRTVKPPSALQPTRAERCTGGIAQRQQHRFVERARLALDDLVGELREPEQPARGHAERQERADLRASAPRIDEPPRVAVDAQQAVQLAASRRPGRH